MGFVRIAAGLSADPIARDFAKRAAKPCRALATPNVDTAPR